MRNRGALLGSVMLIILASMLVGAGTTAYFSDTEESTGNKFEAGTCTIKLTGKEGVASAIWTFDNLKPGDTVVGTFYIENTGSLRIWDVLFDVDIGTVKSAGWVGLAKAIMVDTYNAAGGMSKEYADLNLDANRPWASKYGKSVYDWTISMEGIALCDDDDLLKAKTFHDWAGGYFLDPGMFLAYEWAFTFPDTDGPQDDLQGEYFNLILRFEARTTDSACS